MGDDLYSRGRGFESQRHILDGHFFTFICFKNCIVRLRRPKINEKEAEVGPFLKKGESILLERKAPVCVSGNFWHKRDQAVISIVVIQLVNFARREVGHVGTVCHARVQLTLIVFACCYLYPRVVVPDK